MNSRQIQAAIRRAQSLVDGPLSLAIGQGYDSTPDDLGNATPRKYDLYLDIREYDGVDIVSPWQSVDLPKETFYHVFSSQTIEHLLLMDQEEALRRTYAWLVPGGTLEIWTPDLVMQTLWVTSGVISWEWFQKIANGDQEQYPENAHIYLHTRESLVSLVERSGFILHHCDVIEGSLSLLARKV